MSTQLTIYKSIARDDVLVNIEVDYKTLNDAIYSRKELANLYISAWVNNALIHPDDWHLFELTPFDHIHLVGQPQKGALPIVGAVIGITLGLIFPPAGATGWALFASALKGAAIGYSLGSVADSLIFPPTVPQISSDSENPNYGWDGARLVTKPDGPVSVLYGQHRVSGTLIMQYPSTDGTKNYLNMLINLGEGPIEGIMKYDETGVCSSTSDDPAIEINGQPFNNYENCTFDYRLGTWNQSVIDGFHGTKTFYSDGRKVTKGTPVTYTTTGTDITDLEIQLYCATLFFTLDNGEITNANVDLNIQYKLTSDSDWIDYGNHSIQGKTKTVIYKYISLPGLTAGQYDIKITRITPEYSDFRSGGDLYISGITEQTNEDIAYRFSSLLSLKLQATDQLQGTTPNITVLLRGRKVSVPKLTISAETQTYDDCYWDDDAGVYKRTSDDETCIDSGLYVEQWSRNPIWCTRDFILKDRYGLGNYIDYNSFDTSNAATEAKYCWELVTDFDGGYEHRFEIDLPISTYMSAEEAKKMLARTFRGWIIWSNGTYKPIIDRSQDPIWLFNSSNMFPKTVKTTYFKASAIPNFVEVQHADPDRNYSINTLEIVDESEWTDSKPLRKATINAVGTVRKSQNLRDGKYYLNSGVYCTKAIEFEVPEALLRVEPGDTVQLQEDLLAWGVGGRIVSATSSSITTNIDITYSVGYEVRVRLPDFTLETKTVTSVTNNNRTLNISGTFTGTPIKDSIFTYGASDIDSKPFKVKTITRMANDNFKLLLSEESSNKYNDTTGVSLPEPKYTYLPSPSELPDNVEDLALSEMSNRPGFYISFNIPQEDIAFHHADVLLSLDASNYWIYRSSVKAKSDIEVLNTKPGTTYYVKVISYNHLGMANISPVTASITTTDTNFKPPQINGLRLDGESTLNSITFTKKDAKFTWVKTSVVDGAGHLPAGQEPLGIDQFFEEIKIKYWVEIWVSGSRVRREIVTDNSYIYTYEKNLADNSGTPSASLTIKVWGYNEKANLKSNYSSDLAVSNPSPSVVTSLTVQGTASTTEFVGRDVNVRWTAPSDPDIQNYKVIITDASDNILRTDYVADALYSYTYDKNGDDNSGTPINSVKVKVYTQDWFSQLSSSTVIQVTNAAPANVSGLAATAYPRAIGFDWTRNSENDISHYTYRTQVEADGWSDWITINNNHLIRTLTDTEISDHTSEANIQIEVKAVDTFGNESASAASANDDCLSMSIAATDIDDFAITASKTFTKIPILESDSWTNNSPSAGYVAWNEHTLYYNGVAYTIASGNTDKKYIYWLNGLSLYSSSDTNPVLTDSDFVIAVNIDGTHDLAWNAIANQVIGSAYIENASITNAKIIDLAAEKIVASELSAISANLGTITAGYIESVDIVSSTFKTAASGKRIQITSDGMVLWTTDLTGKWGNFTWGDGTLWGSGALAYVQHSSEDVPFYIAAEQTVADFHFYNRSSTPSGAAEVGDLCVKSGTLYICTGAGTPGTWAEVGGSTTLTDFSGGNWKTIYTDGSGDVTELALGASGKVLTANGTTSAPTWELLNTYVYNVEDYGAGTGESAATNATAIKAAVAAAEAAGGGIVKFGPGTYDTNSTITADDSNGPIIFEGTGWNTTTLAGTFSGFLITFTAGRNVGVRHMAFDGGAVGNNCNGIGFYSTLMGFVEWCKFDDVAIGIQVGSGSNLANQTFLNNLHFEQYTYGIDLKSQYGTHIDRVLFEGTGTAHIYSNITSDDHFDSIYITNVSGFTAASYGIYIVVNTGSAGTKGRNHIGHLENIIFESTTTAGIRIDGTTTYGRLVLTGYYGDKVWVTNVDNLRVTENEFHAANTWASNTNTYFVANNIAGAGDKPAETFSTTGGLANIVEDTTPQLGGNLDVNGHSINAHTVTGELNVTTANAYNISGNTVLAHGSGNTYLKSTTGQITLQSNNGNVLDISPTGNTVVGGTLTVNGDQTGAADHVFDDYDDIQLLQEWRSGGENLPFAVGDMLNRDRLLRDTILQLVKRIEDLEETK